MTGKLEAEVRLLSAATRFALDPADRDSRADLRAALEAPVEGPLYERLRIAAENALKAPPENYALVKQGLGDLIRTISADATRRKDAEKAEQQRQQELRGPAPVPQPPQQQTWLPYADDDGRLARPEGR